MKEAWILDDYAAALEQLATALAVPAHSDVVKAGCIQYFEFCFELAWKSIKLMSAELGLNECLSPKSCLRLAFGQGWIDDEADWLEMLEARNRLAHTYDAKAALRIYERLPSFLVELQKLQAVLRAEV